MTDAPSPTPSTTTPATPPAAPSGGAPPPAAPVAVTRPEAIPETYWDATANTIKPEFGTHYSEIATFHKTETERLAALSARKPEDIKFEIKLPETVKIPDGMDLKINDNDPRVPVLRELALKNKWTQDQVNELVALDAQQQIAMHAANMAQVAAADAKLGANAPQRKQAVGDWLKGMKDRSELTAEEYEASKVYATDAETVTFLEKIMAKANGSVPGNLGDGNPPKPAEVPMKDRWYGSTPQKAS